MQSDVQSPVSNPASASVPKRNSALVTVVSAVTPGIDKRKLADPLTKGLWGPLPLMLPPPWYFPSDSFGAPMIVSSGALPDGLAVPRALRKSVDASKFQYNGTAAPPNRSL